MAVPVFGQHQPAQVGMAGEAHSYEIELLSLLPVGAREERDQAGDLTFASVGSGLHYGAECLHEGDIELDFSTAGQGVYIQVTGMAAGPLNGVTIASNKFSVTKTGLYKISWDLSADSQGTGKDYECDVFVNGVEQDCASARRSFGAVGSLGVLGATGVVEITNVAHEIEIKMKEVGAGAGTNINIFNANFNISQIGA